MLLFNTSRNVHHALFLSCVLIVCLLNSADLTAQLNGEHGIDGDPATQGENGQDAEITFGSENSEIPPWYFAIADIGGHGGNGGNGIDGDDDDEEAMGGIGGHGGAGGYATAILSALEVQANRHAFARGGRGGDGGIGGRDSSGFQQIGGNGGNGGDATVISNTATNFTKLLVLGGRGGNASGAGAKAGNGGLTSAIAQIQQAAGQQSGTIGIQTFGGHGGVGFAGADAGDGADQILNRQGLQIRYFNEDLFYSRHISIHAQGGNGGHAEFGGIAGAAGNVSVNLPEIASQIGGQVSIFFNQGLSMQGGRGGNAILHGTGFAHGRDGGNVTVEGEGIFKHAFDGQLRVALVGGQGGSAIGRMNRGDGGNGGTVDLSHVKIENAGTVGTTASFNLSLEGGQGGHAQGGGQAGSGGSVNSINEFSIQVPIAARGTVKGKGGDGGSGPLNGHGGNVNVVVDNAIIENGPVNSFSRRHLLTGSAIGGNAGKGISGANTANGGNANVLIKQEADLGVTAFATSSAGIGTNGRSGDSNARSEAYSFGTPPSNPFFEGAYTANAQAIATFNPDPLHIRRPTHGTNSDAISIAISSTDAASFANAEAYGGWGTVQSGTASAVALATQSGTAKATAKAQASIFNNRLMQNNNSYSRASAQSNSIAEATSLSKSIGHFNRNIAWSSIQASSGIARSAVQSSSSNWKHSIKAATEAQLINDSSTTSLIGSTTDSMFRGGHFFDNNSVASSNVILIPNDTFARPLVNSSIQRGVFDADADILGIGQFRGGHASSEFDGTLRVESVMEIDLEVQDYHADKLMTFGLFDFESTGEGFEFFDFSLSYDDALIFSVATDSLSQLNSILGTNNTFFLGSLNDETSLARFQLEFSMKIDNPDDSYGFKFVFGNAEPIAVSGKQGNFGGNRISAVPEPSSAFIAGLTCLAMVSRRRRIRK